jgi:polar amino acid transport system substrate-binding protein
MADAVKTGVWDVAFLAAEPQRANEITFTAAYAEIESTYLVPPGSPLRTIADVDREGVRIAVSEKLPGSRVLDGRFSTVQQSIGTPRGRDAGARYLREFVEDIKATGLVARAIERNGIRGLTVAPLTASQP